MYLHLGQEVVIRGKDIIGIFDLEKTSVSKRTKEFLVEAAHRDEVITVSYEMPKSFVITSGNESGAKSKTAIKGENGQQKRNGSRHTNKVYITQISTATLNKRMRSG